MLGARVPTCEFCVHNKYPGTGHPGASEAAVPVGVLAQVLLVVILRVVKGLSLPDAW